MPLAPPAGCTVPVGATPRAGDFGLSTSARSCIVTFDAFEARLREFGAWPGYMSELQPDFLTLYNQLQMLPHVRPQRDGAMAEACFEQTLYGVPLAQAFWTSGADPSRCFWYQPGGVDQEYLPQLASCRRDALCAPCALVRDAPPASWPSHNHPPQSYVSEYFVCANGQQPYAWLTPPPRVKANSTSHAIKKEINLHWARRGCKHSQHMGTSRPGGPRMTAILNASAGDECGAVMATGKASECRPVNEGGRALINDLLLCLQLPDNASQSLVNCKKGRGTPGAPGRTNDGLHTWPVGAGPLSFGHVDRAHADYQYFDVARPRRWCPICNLNWSNAFSVAILLVDRPLTIAH